MDSSEHIIVEVAIGVGGAIVGAIGAYYLSLRLEQRKQRAERALAAYQACLNLKETLANWMNEIADATREEKSSEDVMQRLQSVFEHEKFERQVDDHFSGLKDEPLCVGLVGKANGFTVQAFESKRQIRMALIAGEFTRNYQGHRNEARRQLQSVYDDFGSELARVIPLLKHKARL
jgi:urease gamma subunit